MFSTRSVKEKHALATIVFLLLVFMGIFVSFETDIVREARVKADKSRKDKKGKNKGAKDKGGKKPPVDKDKVPTGGEIGATGVRLWTRGQFNSGAKSLTRDMEEAAMKANSVSGYTLPGYARKGCMSSLNYPHFTGSSPPLPPLFGGFWV